MAQITAELALEITKLKAGLEAARTEIRGFKANAEREGGGMGNALFGKLRDGLNSGLGAVGFGGGVLGFAAGVKGILNEYDDLADTALRLNESTEVVQRVGGVAELSGGSVEGLVSSFLKLEKALGNVENKKARELLERYGYTVEQILAMPLDQKILAFADAFQRARQDGSGVNDMMSLLGDGASELIPLLSQTREELEGAFAAVKVVDDADVQRLAAMNDQFDLMVKHLKALTAERGSNLVDWGEFLARTFGEGMKDFDWQAVMKNAGGGYGIMPAFLSGFGQGADKAMGDMSEADTAAALEKIDEDKRKKEQAERARREAAAARDAAALAKGGEELEKTRVSMLPEEERLNELLEQRAALIGEMNGASQIDDMVAWAQSFNGDAEALKAAVDKLKEARDLEKEIKDIIDKRSQEIEKREKEKAQREKEVGTLREQTDKNAIGLLSPRQQALAMREQLAQSLGLDITSGGAVSQGLAKLKEEADAAKARGDLDGEKSALERLKKAQEQAGDLAALGSGSRPSALAGETTGVLNMLLGRGGKDLVVDETKANGVTLKSIERVLNNIDRWNREGADGDPMAFGFNLDAM